MVKQYITAIMLGVGMILLSITPKFFEVQQQNVMAKLPYAQPPANPSARSANPTGGAVGTLPANPTGGATANVTGGAPGMPPVNVTAKSATAGTPAVNPAGRGTTTSVDYSGGFQ